MSMIDMEEEDQCQHCPLLAAKVVALEQKLAEKSQDFEDSHNLSHRIFIKFLEANVRLWQHQVRLKAAEDRVVSSEGRLKVSQERARSRELFLKRSNQDLRASLDRQSATGRKVLEKLATLRDGLTTTNERPPTPQSEQYQAFKDTEDLRIEMDNLCRDMALLAATQSVIQLSSKDAASRGDEMAKLLEMQETLAQTLDQLCMEANAVKEHNKLLVTDLEKKDKALEIYSKKLEDEEARSRELGEQVEELERMMPLGWMTQRPGTVGLVGLRKKKSQVHSDRQSK